MRALPLSIGTLHFVGIGGIGMSGIAEVLHNLGYAVQGSDMAETANVKRLRELGIRIMVGHDAENIKDAQEEDVAAVIVSSAIPKDNPEVVAAHDTMVPVVRRAEMLAELMRLKWCVSVGGTHGKTTTTSLVGNLLERAGYDPTVINGGIVNAYGTNTRLGDGDWMVVEADESDGTFVRLPSTIAIVTNIDAEHLDFYGDFDAVKEAFRRFVDNVPFYGFAAMCTDDANVQALLPEVSDRRIVTYGTNPQADIRAVNITNKPDGCSYDVELSARVESDPDKRLITGVELPMLGMHNVRNSLATVAVGVEMGVSQDIIRNGFKGFAGVKRRFTKTGEANGITVIDDYGHHPVEITAVLSAARAWIEGRKAAGKAEGKVIAVMQPHRYTRLSSLFEDFCTCFNDADHVIVADVYAANEKPIEGADRDALVAGLKKHGHRKVTALEGADALPGLIADVAEPGDLVVCLGAGDITKWANALPGELEKLTGSKNKAAGGGA